MRNNCWKFSIGLYLGLTFNVFSVHAASGPVGSIDGIFSVTPGGTATYQIPIKVPTGIGGIKPTISLAYRSQSGNGLLGVGWSISGLSSIIRCPHNLSQDGQIRGVKLDANDRFCLDGQRLVAVTGTYGQNNTEYRTEQDIFSKIISKGYRDNGPESFEVLTKDGLHMQFGDISESTNGQFNSRFALHSSKEKEAVHIWAISRIADNVGNVINFRYQFVGNEDDAAGISSTTGYNREYYPDEITYSGGGKLSFNYGPIGSETRPDPTIGYRAGGKLKTTKRLKKITVKIANRLVREYSLTYKSVDDSNQSRLASIAECGTDGECFYATKFSWLSDKNSNAPKWGNESSAFLPSDVVLAHSDGNNRGVRFVDLDGDGVKDIVYHRWINANTEPEVGAYLYKNNTWQPAPSYYPPYPLVRDDEAQAGTEIIDINGDGLVDFVYSRLENAKTHKSAAYLNDGTGWVRDTSRKFDPKYPIGHYNNENRISRFVDLNGDGLVDLVHRDSKVAVTCIYKDHTKPLFGVIHTHRDCVSSNVVINQGAYLGTPAGWSENQPSHIPPIAFEVLPAYYEEGVRVGVKFSPPPKVTRLLDINGDGLDDLLFYTKNTSGVYLKTSVGWETSPDSSYVLPVNLYGDGYGESGVRFVDINGDGLVDIVQNRYITAAEAVSYKSAYLNTGNGWVQNDAYIPPQPVFIKADGTIKRVAHIYKDVNSDGLVDLLFQRWDDNTQGAYLNTGVGWDRNDDYSSPYDLILNDGKSAGTRITDINGDAKLDVLHSYDSGSALKTSLVKRHLVKSINTGLGVNTAISYKPLTDQTVYTKGTTDCQSPVQCAINSSLVVGEHRVSNGIDGTARYTYKYADARIHNRGRGWLGFASRTITDAQTQQSTTTTYDNHTFNAEFNVFPFLSLPKKVIVTYPGGILGYLVTSEVINNYSVKRVEGNPYYSVYLQNSTAEEKNLDGSALKYVSTTTEMDDFGNATDITIDTRQSRLDSIFAYRQTTTNAYDNDTLNWHLGRLKISSVTSFSGTDSQTRNTAYGYYPNGMLYWTEDEPTDPDLYLKTEYVYDAYGNNKAVTVNGAPSASYPVAARTATSDFNYSSIQYPMVTATVPVEGSITQSENKVYDARWGKLIRQTGPNGLTSWTYDSFGRRASETRPDDTTTTWTYDWCDGTDTSCPVYAVYKVTTSSSDGSTSVIYKDKFSRKIRTKTLGLDGVVVQQDTEYDAAGRVWRSSRPYFKGASNKYWTSNTFDALGRVKTRTNPDSSIVTNDYEGLQTTISTERRMGDEYTSLSVRQINNLAGKVEWVFDAHNKGTRYTYLPFGELETVTDPMGNVILMEYDNRGRKTKLIDPDMGTWQYATDALGNLRWQQDAKGQETTMSYDLLNRMKTRVDERNQADSTSVEKIDRWEYYTEADVASNCRSIGKLKSSTDGSITKSFCYDGFGRITLATSSFDGASYTVTTAYDAYSRVKTITYPTQDAGNQAAFIKRNVYDFYGNLKAVEDGVTNAPLWTAKQVNASGNLTSETFGNGLTTYRGYDAKMGFLTSNSTGAGTSNGVQSQEFEYDSLGTLISRTDHNRIITLPNGTTQNGTVERFTYDALNRVSSVLRDGQQTAQYQYDALGNITFNSELGTYHYNSTRPHAVTEISRSNTGALAGDISGDGRINGLDAALLARSLVGLSTLSEPQALAADCNAANGVTLDDAVCIASHAGSTSNTIDETLTYDANGNMKIGIAGKVITYTAFNKPETITKGENSTRFEYDIGRARYLQVATSSSGTTKTHYLGQLFERTQKTSGITEYKNYIYAGKRMIAISTRRSNNTTELNYLHRDHITSITAITDASGIVKERFSYDVFGKRRNDASWKAASTLESIVTSVTVSSITHHGYTEHEFLEGVGLIHMNGRVFDPELGRFLSADPFVQFKKNLQSFNRYSYLLNNPLSYTDPSGYFLDGVIDDIGQGVSDFADDVGQGINDFTGEVGDFWRENKRTIIAIGIVAIPGINVVAAGFLSSYISSGGDLRAAIVGGITAGAFAGVGDAALAGSWGSASKVLAHGMVGGVSSVMNGGSFKAGFLSAAVTQTASASGVFSGLRTRGGTAIASALVGGTTSVLSGGKFKNGAMTGAFSRMMGDTIRGAQYDDSWSSFGADLKNITGKIWNAPNTALGLLYGFAGVALGGDWPLVRNNAIQFENSSLIHGKDGLTVGNTIFLGGSESVLTASGVPMGTHEMSHTYQGEILGLLYLPSNILGGAASLLTSGNWHGPANWNERGPQSVPSKPW
ncbi:MAG: hypothetical protein GXP17_08395 [Gammaproteobacteria bacterium]|nr:hypothetical protein [Gammaproteobacteria bacterium]